MKGKGKKGKKGKNKDKWSSKDGKGDGGKDHFANAAAETPQPSSSTTHRTFFTMNADYDLLVEFSRRRIFMFLMIHVFRASCLFLKMSSHTSHMP